MGKWTATYYDEVLSAKIKSLVSGAIKRSKLEKTEPTISYESFVEELDAGDSFTTAILDCLVKELADRRTRPDPNDRRLVGERTAKSLRLITTPPRLYFDRPTTSRRQNSRSRGVNLPAYLTSPPDEMDLEEDEDEFDNFLEPNATSAEGARINSEMYDAFTQSVPSSSASSSVFPFPRSSSPAPMSSTEEPLGTVVPAFFPPPTGGTWSEFLNASRSHSSSGVNLARQSSIRRPARSRTVDFNDFTSRRRSSIRDSLGSRTERSDATHEGSSSRESNRDRESGARAYPSRRFFSAVPRHRRIEPGDINVWNDMTETDESTPSPGATVPNAHWVAVPRIVSTNDISETSDERTEGVPRLRRGGLRAPESILSRHVSPVVDSRGAPSPPNLILSTDSVRLPSETEAAAYPTPGSVDNENSS